MRMIIIFKRFCDSCHNKRVKLAIGKSKKGRKETAGSEGGSEGGGEWGQENTENLVS